MNLKSKLVGVFAALTLVFSGAVSVQGATTAQLIDLLVSMGIISADQVATVQAAVGGTTGVGSAQCEALKAAPNMTVGAQGTNVTNLQNWLIAEGHSIPAGATGYFGAQTQAALAAYQSANGIAPAAGYFGPITRASITCAPVTVTPPTDTTPSTGLQGQAGDINVTQTAVEVENEVAEGDTEKVLGFRVEAEDSDVRITNLRVVLENTDAPNTNRRPDRYLSEISVWMGDKKVGSVDPRDLTRDGNVYSRNISLTDSIVRRGAANRQTFYIAFTALDNIDSLDMADASFDLDVENIRFEDGAGALMTSTQTVSVSGIEFTDPATAGDVRLRASLGSNNPLERVVEVHEFSTTNDITLLEFRLKAEARDMFIEDIDVELNSTINDLDEILADVRLFAGNQLVADVSSFDDDTTETVEFELYDPYMIEADETVTFRVVARVLQQNGNFASGATLNASAVISNTGIFAEDRQGNQIMNFTGSANGYDQKLVVDGALIEYVSSSSQATNQDNTSRDYTLVFDVTAIGEDVVINRNSFTATGVQFDLSGNSDVTDDGITAALTSNASFTSPNYTVFEGQTRRFTLTVNANSTGGDVSAGTKTLQLISVAGNDPVTTIEGSPATLN